MPRQSAFLALQLFLAAALSLGTAYALGLGNPFWAAMPVWVVHQSYREDLLLRASLRLAGTVAGAALALALLWVGAPPAVLAGCLILGGALATASAYWIGTVMSYGAFMLGVTLLVVLLPDLAGLSGLIAGHADDGGLALALGRVACTLIGVVLVTAITFPFTPRRIAPPPPRRSQGLCRATLRRGVFCLAVTSGAVAGAMALPRFDVMSGAMTLVIYAMILSAAPDPRPILRGLAPGVAIGATAALAFLALTLPMRAQGEVLVPALIACGFLAAGALLRAHPRTHYLGLDSNMCFLLAAEVGTWRHGLADAGAAGLGVVLAAILASGLGRLVVVPAPRLVA